MNDKKNEAVRIITALFGGLAGGFFAAVIVLFALQKWTMRMDVQTVIIGCIFAVFLPACLDVFARYEIPLMAAEVIMIGVSYLITSLYASQTAGNTAALDAMNQLFVIFHVLALIVVAVRFFIRRKAARR
ncbi:MAG: hypothetical protein IJJ29_07085 [Solobacterium sp.]|nr:hypothetical protein [Solobacterium sp.]